jgi:hypothetical protein
MEARVRACVRFLRLGRARCCDIDKHRSQEIRLHFSTIIPISRMSLPSPVTFSQKTQVISVCTLDACAPKSFSIALANAILLYTRGSPSPQGDYGAGKAE